MKHHSVPIPESESRSVVSDSLQPHGLVHGILQARILEWVAFPFSSGSPQPRDRTQVSHTAGRFFPSWATREAWGKIKCKPCPMLAWCTPGTPLFLDFSHPQPWKVLGPRALYPPLPPNLLLQRAGDPYPAPYTLPLSWSLLLHHTDSLGSTVCSMCLQCVCRLAPLLECSNAESKAFCLFCMDFLSNWNCAGKEQRRRATGVAWCRLRAEASAGAVLMGSLIWWAQQMQLGLESSTAWPYSSALDRSLSDPVVCLICEPWRSTVSWVWEQILP